MTKKAPRRTAQRILETTLELFNRFGEPNVSTTLISAELNISPGNLYYHYPSKDELVNTLFDGYERILLELLAASDDVHDVDDVWFFMHSLFELIWKYRFLYRDLNHLLSRNRHLETHFQTILERKKAAVGVLLDQLGAADQLQMDAHTQEAVSASMVVLLTYWLSYEYVLKPRQAMEEASAQDALLRGGYHVLCTLLPYLRDDARVHLQQLLLAYLPTPQAPRDR